MVSLIFQASQKISLTETEAGPKGRPKQAFGPSLKVGRRSNLDSCVCLFLIDVYADFSKRVQGNFK